jgi:hypothetical protein
MPSSSDPEVSDEKIFLRVPDELVEDGLLEGLPSAWEGGIRGPVLDGVIVVINDAVGITSGLVTIGVAHHEIAVLARRIIAMLRRQHASMPTQRPFSIQIKRLSGEVFVTADDEEALRELVTELRRMVKRS